MDKADITQVVNALITENKLNKALKALSEYVQGIDGDIANDLLLQTAAFNRNEKDRRNGLIAKEDYTMGISRLNYNLTQIIDKLPEKGNDVVIETLPPNETVSPSSTQSEATNGTQKILFLAAAPEDQVQRLPIAINLI